MVGDPNTHNAYLRWSNIISRTAHIGVAAGLFGGVVFYQPHGLLASWHYLTICSGIVLLVCEWLHDRNWPHRAKGLLVYLHIILGGLVHLFPDQGVVLLWGVVISGCVGSHMPRRLRHWSIIHGAERPRE